MRSLGARPGRPRARRRARARATCGRADRASAPLSTFDAPADADDWDSRVYAISPGSAAFLRGLGAWQRCPPSVSRRSKSMDVRGDGGGAIEFSAYELGERALAWIVENRALRAALVESVRCVRAHRRARALRTRGARLAQGRGAATLDRRAHAVRTPARRRRRRALVAAPRSRDRGASRSPTRKPRSSPISRPSSEHRGRALQWFLDGDGACWRGCRCPGRRISIVWSAPDALARELLPRSMRRRSRSASRMRAARRWARLR